MRLFPIVNDLASTSTEMHPPIAEPGAAANSASSDPDVSLNSKLDHGKTTKENLETPQ